MKPLTIGDVARQAGVGVETVRFYERQGLLEEPQRRASGYRQYDGEAVDVLRFIRRAKELASRSRRSRACWPCGWTPRPHEPRSGSRPGRKSPTSRPGSPTSGECVTCY